MHLDAELLKDLFRGTVAKDKLSILAERQLNELIHAMKCKCASSPVSGKTLYYQFHCAITSFSVVKNTLITLLVNSKSVTKTPKW